jgi:CheY-like chemotaxis protein
LTGGSDNAAAMGKPWSSAVESFELDSHGLQPVAGASPAVAPGRTAQSSRVLVVAAPAAVHRYGTGPLRRISASTTRDALAAIEQLRPVVVVIDWDSPAIDVVGICRAACRFSTITVMATMRDAAHAPRAIKAGCQAILLEPLSPSLIATRIARLARPVPPLRGAADAVARGTNQSWRSRDCPACAAPGVISFEFATRRTCWFTCLQCDHVWDAPPG